MKYSPYARLEEEDIIQDGDEVRFDTPFSHFSQNVDISLDHLRMQWNKFFPCWIGKKFSSFLKGSEKFGKIDARRLIEKIV